MIALRAAANRSKALAAGIVLAAGVAASMTACGHGNTGGRDTVSVSDTAGRPPAQKIDAVATPGAPDSGSAQRTAPHGAASGDSLGRRDPKQTTGARDTAARKRP